MVVFFRARVYTSLWILDFGRLKGEKPDPLAMEYLGEVDGGRWYHSLASFASGRIDFGQLLSRADTRGKRAEAYFYEAMRRFAAGHEADAKALLRNVVATDMLGFFEYDMASYFLANGPPR